MAAGDTLVVFQAEHSQPPDTSFATMDVRNGHVVLDFDDSTVETTVFSGIVPRHFSGGNIVLVLVWAATAASTGNVRWNASFERHQEGADDLDSDSYAAAKAITGSTATASGLLTYSEIGFSMAEADGIVAGEHFRIKVARDANDAADTLAGDAELLGMEFREASNGL